MITKVGEASSLPLKLAHMPSIISHAAVPLALGMGLRKKRVPTPILVAGVAAAMLPDADVFLFRFGATYDSVWSHRGFTHSLAFAMFIGLLAALLFRRAARPMLVFAFVAASAASHGLLDMMTNGGHGVAFLWPFTDQRYFFDWRPIQVSPLDARRFFRRAAGVAETELLWIWLPAIILVIALRAGAKKSETP